MKYKDWLIKYFEPPKMVKTYKAKHDGKVEPEKDLKKRYKKAFKTDKLN